MSGRVLSFSPQSKTYVPRAANGKYSPAGPMKVVDKAIVPNVAPPAPGPAILSQYPVAPIGAGPVIKR